MFANIVSDYKAYRRPLLAQGFYACLIHRFGYATSHSKIGPFRWVAKLFHLILIKVSEVLFGIYIGPNVIMGKAFVIEHFGGVIIHSSTRIGNNVRIRQGVTIGNKSVTHPNDVPNIGDNVDVGAGAKILGPVRIGDGAVIGANAVVIRDVPPGAIAVGVPAHLVKSRMPPPNYDAPIDFKM